MKNNTGPAKRFAPEKSLVIPATLFLIHVSAILVLQVFRKLTPIDLSDWIAIGIWALFLAYYCWQWFGTYYELRNGELFYRSGFTKGSIPVSSIRKIETHTRSWANTNAAIATKGMMITYHKWDELFIAPKDVAGFLKAILQINPGIEIKSHAKPEQLASK